MIHLPVKKSTKDKKKQMQNSRELKYRKKPLQFVEIFQNCHIHLCFLKKISCVDIKIARCETVYEIAYVQAMK